MNWLGSRGILGLLLCFIVGCGAASAVASAQELPPPPPPVRNEGLPAPREPVQIAPTASDAQIAERLRNILEATTWFRGPRVSVRDGVVFLDGIAATQEHRRWAGTLAQNTQGAVAVVNRIEVDADVGSLLERARAEFTDAYTQIIRSWPTIILLTMIVVVTFLLARLVGTIARWLLARRISSPLLLVVTARALSIPVLLLGIYFVLQIAGLTRLALTVIGGTGLLGLVIGFAFRDIAENFLASLLLSIRNPFTSGDLIEVAGHTGIVQNLNSRTTVLLTLDGNHVQIPNAMVYKSVIRNFSSTPTRRAEFDVGIGYESPIEKAQELISDVLAQHPAVLGTPEPLVLVDMLDSATVNLRVTYWIDGSTYSPAKTNSALLRLTKNALLNGGIELPDSAREVVFPKGVPIVQADQIHASDRPARVGADGETSTATSSEGSLSNETTNVKKQAGAVVEAKENFLKSPTR